MKISLTVGVALKAASTFALILASTNCLARDQLGTYSNLSYNKESGDLHGFELSIIPTDVGLVAAIQVVEDGVNQMHVARIQKADDSLKFSIPIDGNGVLKFVLKCSESRCAGEYSWGYEKAKITLPKSDGYWNKR